MSQRPINSADKVVPGARVFHWRDPKLHGTVLSRHDREERRMDRTGHYHCNLVLIKRAKVLWDDGTESVIVVKNLIAPQEKHSDG